MNINNSVNARMFGQELSGTKRKESTEKTAEKKPVEETQLDAFVRETVEEELEAPGNGGPNKKWGGLRGLWNKVKDGAKSMFNSISKALSPLKTAFNNVVDWIMNGSKNNDGIDAKQATDD